MTWRAWLDGENFDPQALSAAFPSGDAVVRLEQSSGCYIESSAINGQDNQPDHEAAKLLLERMNGAARALDPGFRPVAFAGRYTSSEGDTIIVGATAHSEIRGTASISIDRSVVPRPPAKGSRYTTLADRNPNVD